MTDCIFCKIIKKEIPAEITYEGDNFISFMDLKPNNYGHSLVVPKEHYENIYELPKELGQELVDTIQKVSKAIKESVGAEGINIIMNNEAPAGQVVFHQHTHVIPRYKGDELKHFSSKEYQDENHIKEIAEDIRSSF